MTHAEDVDLAALALGETDEVPPEVAAHVASCAGCTAEVRALEATLAVARRTPDAPLVAPPPSVWAGIEAALPPSPAVPAAPARVRRRSTVPAWLAAAAVVAALALGAVLGRTLDTGPGTDRPAPDPVVARASLVAVGGTADRGSAVMVRHDGQMVLWVRVSDLGTTDGGFHEVWLLNRDGKRLVSIGLLSAAGRGEFVVPERLVSEGYVTVDVSAEPDDGVPAHSGDSVARGELGLRSGA